MKGLYFVFVFVCFELFCLFLVRVLLFWDVKKNSLGAKEFVVYTFPHSSAYTTSFDITVVVRWLERLNIQSQNGSTEKAGSCYARTSSQRFTARARSLSWLYKVKVGSFKVINESMTR